MLTASVFTHMFFCPLGVPGELFLYNLWILIHLSLGVPPFDGKAIDLFAGEHLKYLSAKSGA